MSKLIKNLKAEVPVKLNEIIQYIAVNAASA